MKFLLWLNRRRRLSLLFICLMGFLFSGCAKGETVVPKEIIECEVAHYNRINPENHLPGLGYDPGDNIPFFNCFAITSFTQLNQTEGVNSIVVTKDGGRALRDIYHIPYFRTHDLLILCERPSGGHTYNSEGLIYSETTGQYELHLRQIRVEEREFLSQRIVAIEVEKGMFPEGTEPYFPKIVYTPYRG